MLACLPASMLDCLSYGIFADFKYIPAVVVSSL